MGYNETRGGGYRLTIEVYAKYSIFDLKWKLGAVAKFYKRKRFLFIKYWARKKADSIQMSNMYWKNRHMEGPPAYIDDKTCIHAKGCKQERVEYNVLGEPKLQSVEATATAIKGNIVLTAGSDAGYGLPGFGTAIVEKEEKEAA